jgi:hypothetical protein
MYGKVNGKQIKDTSLDLLKLDFTGSQGLFLYGTGSYLGSYELNPSSPYAFITKQYVDTLAAGLDPKASVYLVSTSNITTSGTISIDGLTASLGKRILLTSQINSIDNGIYLVGPTAWTRASDSNNDPTIEVSLGNYVFVERGMSYSSTGWILYDTNAIGSTVSVGIDTQLWTQFNGAGSLIWANGIGSIGNNIYIDIAPNGGLTFSSTQLTLANYVAGNGITLNNGILNVGSGTGITVGSDTISISNTGVIANTYGDPLTIPSLTFNAQGQVIAATAVSILISTGQVSNFTSSVVGLIKGGTGISVSSDSGGATISIENTGIISNTYGSSTTVDQVTFNTQGQAIAATSISIQIPSSQVTNFTSSVQSLAVNVLGGTGIDVSSIGGYATISIANTGVISGNYGTSDRVNTFSVNSQGQLTSIGTVSISITSGQIINFTSSVQSSINIGNGLTSSAGTISVNIMKGVTFSNSYLLSDANTILTTANLSNISIGTNSTIQSALSAIDNFINTISNQQEISISNNPTGTFLTTVNAPFNMLGYTFSTASDGVPQIYINGVYVKTNATTASSPAYFSTDNGISGNISILPNSSLYLNAFILGFKLDPTDDVVVHYLTKYP